MATSRLSLLPATPYATPVPARRRRTVLECIALAKRYGDRTALEGLTLRLEEGTIAGLLGLNGAGKTTALQMMAGLATPDGGQVRVEGRDATAGPGRPRLGYVPEQNVVPLPAWTAQEYLGFFAARHGMGRVAGRRRVEDLAGLLAFQDHLHARMGALSGGTRRKVDLARALLPEPRVLLLDEPTREMDIPTKRAVWSHLRNLAAQGVAILVASHDALEVHRLCGEATVLRGGRVVFQGPVAQLAGGAGPDLDARLGALLAGESA